jgi:hypothetical protein
MKIILVVIMVFIIYGCDIQSMHTSIDEYKKVSGKIELGDTKENVLSILLPTQKEINKYPGLQKSPEKYIKDNVLVEIYFMRSGHQRDGLTTDDEFTPYVFNDGKLVGIGWAILGGASSQGQATSDTNVIVTPPPPVIYYNP